MLKTKVLQPKHLFILIVLLAGIQTHVMIIPFLLNKGGRDSWVSVLLMSVPFALYIWMISKMISMTKQEDLRSWFTRYYGKIASTVLMFLFVFIFYINSYITLKDSTEWLGTFYLPEVDPVYILLSLTIICFSVSCLKIEKIVITGSFLLPFVIVLGILIATVNTPKKNIQALFPILENGFKPVGIGMIAAGAGLIEICVVLLLQSYAQSKIKPKQLFFLGAFLFVLMLGPLTGAIMEFGLKEAANLRYPAHEEWRIFQIGQTISQLDFFAMYQWLCGALIRIGLGVYFFERFLNKKEKIKRVYLLAILFCILFIVCLLKVDSTRLYGFIFSNYYFYYFWALLSLTVLYWVLIIAGTKRGPLLEKTSKENTTQKE